MILFTPPFFLLSGSSPYVEKGEFLENSPPAPIYCCVNLLRSFEKMIRSVQSLRGSSAIASAGLPKRTLFSFAPQARTLALTLCLSLAHRVQTSLAGR